MTTHKLYLCEACAEMLRRARDAAQLVGGDVDAAIARATRELCEGCIAKIPDANTRELVRLRGMIAKGTRPN